MIAQELHRASIEEPGCKSIIFSQFTSMLDLVEHRCVPELRVLFEVLLLTMVPPAGAAAQFVPRRGQVGQARRSNVHHSAGSNHRGL